MKEVASRCSICSEHRWAVDNMYLSRGTEAAKELCAELGISQSAFYRHIKSHLSLCPSTPPAGVGAIEWCRATTNLVAAVERYRIVLDPSGITYIGTQVGVDKVAQYVELVVAHRLDALDLEAVASMAYELSLDVEDPEIVPGMNPIHRLSMKLHADEVFVGRMNRKEED